MKLNVSQINQDQLSLAIQQYSSGAAFSGNFVWYVENSGFLGPLAVTTTGSQVITGSKRFLDPILVEYSGGSGAAPSARWVSDQIVSYSGQASADYATKTQVFDTGAALSKVRVTGSSRIQDVNFTGLGGTLVVHSGDYVFISGAAGGGGAGGSNVLVTGSSTISSANFSGAGSVVLTYDGTYVRVSGTAGADATLSGYVESNFVNRTTDQSITGIKTFVSSPIVPTATSETQAISLGQLSGTSGVLVSLNLSTSGVLYAQMTGASGVLATAGGGTTNNYSITGTGSVFITNNSTGAAISNTINVVSGNVTTNTNNYITDNTINYSGLITGLITGNFYNISFFLDPVATGLNLVESFVSNGFYFTGAAYACRTTGFGPVNGGILSGKLYQVDFNNTEQTLLSFTFSSGVKFATSALQNTYVTGNNRVGLTLTNSLSGIEKFSVGVFGGGYA